MIGVPGTAQRLFGALREHGISVVAHLAGQLGALDLLRARRRRRPIAPRRWSATPSSSELRQGQIQRVDVTRDCSILAVVGDGMAGTPGIAAKLFNALGTSGVNVRAIAQGASERNISVVIDEKQTARALGSVHASFYLSPHTVSIGLIGPGIGRQRLSRSAGVAGGPAHARLQARSAPARASSRPGRWCSPTRRCRWRNGASRSTAGDAAGPAALRASRRRRAPPARGDRRLHGQRRRRAALPRVARGGHPRRHAEQAGGKRGHGVLPIARRGPPRRRIALPLRGDRRRRTADHPDGARPARDRRPHPADRGRPVRDAVVSLQRLGRRAAVLGAGPGREGAGLHRAGSARRSLGHGRRAQAGHPGARDGPRPRARRRRARRARARVAASPATPTSSWRACPRSTPPCAIASRRRARAAACCATSGGSTPTRGRATVGLVELDRSHLFANISLTDNVVSFTTSRYDRNPLVVRGPGAGPAVTAGGVFADLLRVCAYLGAHL